MLHRYSLLFASFFFTTHLLAARVDSIDIPSKVMSRSFKAAVVLPEGYGSGQQQWPVLYLLHGGGGAFNDWLKQTPDKNSVKKLADQYKMIIVCPEGQPFSWYLDSRMDKQSQFETYLVAEVIPAIDQRYRTIAGKKGRVITGLSMGGHGALFLATRHPDLFAAAGSMSGAVDMNTRNWNIPPEFRQDVRRRFQQLVGDTNDVALYDSLSVVNMTEKMRSNRLPLIIDCGVDDFLLEANRELHRRLVYQHVEHDYTERPGGHTWPYWQNSLSYHLLFFSQVLQQSNNSSK